MADKKFPEGIRVFKPHDKAPGFVKGDILINKSELTTWLQDQPDQVKLSIKESQKGTYYLEVNTYQGKQSQEQPTDDLPF